MIRCRIALPPLHQALKLLDVLIERSITEDTDGAMRDVLPLMQAREASVWKV